MTRRKPTKEETGRYRIRPPRGERAGRLRHRPERGDCERACVAVEAMEGTDAMLRRAAALVNGRPLALVKVARGREHLLFDVPVVGLDTIPVMRETGTTALAVDAGRTLMLDRAEMISRANGAGIAIWWAMTPGRLELAVVGAGQFGRNHCRVVQESPRAELARRGGYGCRPRR